MMIENDTVLAMLAHRARRDGVTKAEALRQALRNAVAELPEREVTSRLFPRDRVTYANRTIRLRDHVQPLRV